jgi:hypothetical protein
MTPHKPTRPPDINDPDVQNAEQDEEGTQAQDVADDALREAWRPRESNGESRHGGKTNPAQIIPDDVQDVVDHMTDMDRSGRIDMDAFDGEEGMDDEDGSIPQ